MDALAWAAGLLGSQLTLILSLLIPFVGIVVPAVLILGISGTGRHTRQTAIVAFPTASEAPHPVSSPPRFPVAVDDPTETGVGDPGWTCERLRESDIFEGLTDHELRMVASIAERRKVAPGERLAHAGSRGDHLFLILQGEFRLLTHGHEEIPVRMAHAGETLPLAVIIDPPVLVTTLEAITAGEVLAIPRMRLLDLFDVQPMIGLQVYRAAAKSFEHRYRKSLDGLLGALRVAMHPQKRETPEPQPAD